MAAQVAFFVVYALMLSIGSEFAAPIRIFGWALSVAGGALAFGGLATLGPNLTPYPEPVDGGRLVERGVYRWVRHPIYGGIVVGAVGLAVVRGSLVALLVAVAMLGFFRLKAHREEQRLIAAYPGYEAYRERVRATLVPGVI